MINRLRSLTGRSLSVCARGLRVAAGVAELAARELRRDPAAPGTAASQASSAAAPDGAAERRRPPG
jgi:translation elongation factor EF-Ts